MKQICRIIMAVLFVSISSVTAMAAGWVSGQGENSGRWQYELADGNLCAGSSQTPAWQWIDGNADGVAECYAFDGEGWMYAGIRTPDGYEVNADGAWTEGGVVQTRTSGDVSLEQSGEGNNVLIAYFSRTNTTEQAANMIHREIGGTLFEIEPAEAYDGSYSETTERAQREINAGMLPEMVRDVEAFDSYDIIFVGYPIWWGTTPPVVNTFLNAHDFSGKIVIPFCTSGGSGISGSLANINRYCEGADIRSGRDLSGAGEERVRSWLDSLGIEN